MKKIIIFLAIGCNFQLFGQTFNSNWCKGNEFTTIRFYKNDTIKVTCDTVFLLSSASYKWFDKMFINYKGLNTDARKFSALFDYSRVLFENRIKQQDEEYLKLKNELDEIVTNSFTLVHQNSKEMQNVSNALNGLSKNINEAQLDISDAKSLIQKDINNVWKKKIKWGAGGVAIGISATLVILSLAK